MDKEIRTDRIFPLKDATFYPGRDFCDIVYFCPPVEGKKRIWLMTYAKGPVVFIDHNMFKPEKIKKGSFRWIDYGITDVKLAYPRGFGQIKVYGINPQQSFDSYLVITTQTSLELSGSIQDAECILFGISRQNAGYSSINPSTIEAGNPARFTLVYKAGEKGLPRESRIRFNFPMVFARPQTESIKKDGYIRIVYTDCRIYFDGIKVPSDESHRDGDIFYFLPDGLKPFGKIEVEYRTDTTFILPVVCDVMERRYWFSNMPVLSPAVSLDNKKIFVSVSENNGHHIRFIAGKPERLHLFFPGRIRQKDTVNLIGIITDKYRNLVEEKNWKMKINIQLEGNNSKEIKDVSNYLTHRYRFCVDFKGLPAGIYRAKAYDQDTGKLIAVSNPLEIMGKNDKRQEIFWGEIHGHTEMSDGTGKFEGLYTNARNVGCLDFAASADHACYFTDNQWEWMQDITNSFNKNREFCTLIGYEWAGNQGHRNIYTSSRRLKLFRGMYKPTVNLDAVYKEFEGIKNIVAGPHTGHTGDFWRFHNRQVERFLEIYSMWGHFDKLANKILNQGAILGFTGGGDCHSGNVFFSPEDRNGQGKTAHFTSYQIRYKCGITGAFLEDLDRENLIYCLRNRKTYATTGDRILVDFSISQIKMGEIGKVEDVLIKADIHGCDTIKKIEVIRNGKIIKKEYIDKMDVVFNYEDNDIEKGKYWYYLKITQKNKEVAYTSPVWLEI